VSNSIPLLLPNEYHLGEYHVTLARYTPSGWKDTVPPLKAAVTNYRLLLQPQTRRPYNPASIPSTYITKVSDVTLDHRSGVMIALKTGQRLYLFVGWASDTPFTETLQAMLTSPVGTAAFHHQLRQRDLKRMIQFISQL
jgi:hypothetical protein